MLCISLQTHQEKAHLNERTARGTWSLPESKLHINFLELKAVFLALKEFQDLCLNNIVLVATDNTTVVAYINKEEGMKSGPLLCQETGNSQSSTHPRPAVRDNRQTVQTGPDHSNRMVSPSRGPPSNIQQVAPASSGPGSTNNCHSLCHQFQTPRPGHLMRSVCPRKIWTHMPSH